MSGVEDNETDVNFVPKDKPDVRIKKIVSVHTHANPLPRISGDSRESPP